MNDCACLTPSFVQFDRHVCLSDVIWFEKVGFFARTHYSIPPTHFISVQRLNRRWVWSSHIWFSLFAYDRVSIALDWFSRIDLFNNWLQSHWPRRSLWPHQPADRSHLFDSFLPVEWIVLRPLTAIKSNRQIELSAHHFFRIDEDTLNCATRPNQFLSLSFLSRHNHFHGSFNYCSNLKSVHLHDLLRLSLIWLPLIWNRLISANADQKLITDHSSVQC